MDPVAFRRQNITSNANETKNNLPFTWDRWKNVLTEVAKISNWKGKVAASTLRRGTSSRVAASPSAVSPARWRPSSPMSR